MNTVEKKIIAQEISLYLFAKYQTDEMLKILKGYGVSILDGITMKRQHITKILQQQQEELLKNIQKEENIRPSAIPSISDVTKESFAQVPIKPKKIFISHSEKDLIYVQEIINVLETIGIESTRIFCSSYEGYGNPLGSNYLEVLKEELQGNTLVLFALSHNFFNSKICLCEMGATWILTQDQIPIYIPPFKAEDVKGVFPTTQGMLINRRRQLILLKDRLEEEFNIQNRISYIRWEQQIDRSLKVINDALKQSLL